MQHPGEKTLAANLDDIEQGCLRAAVSVLEGVGPMASEQSQWTAVMPYNEWYGAAFFSGCDGVTAGLG